MKKLGINLVGGGLLASMLLALPLFAAEAPQAQDQKRGRAAAIQVEAVVTAIDLKTREVSLRTANGEEFTVTAPGVVIKLEDLRVGDRVVGSLFAAIEAEIRKPTAAELAEPWVVVSEGNVSKDAAAPGIDAARTVRAVVTIEGMNRETGVVTLKDSRGKLHFIGNVDPEKMTGVSIGQTAVVVFTEAMALTLQKQPAAVESGSTSK
jgi:hypothetical protein